MSEGMLEKIGNVTLDMTYYPGEDFYSEGEAEDALLELVRKHPESEYDKVIQQYCSWSVMYHLSHERENVISWLPISSNEKVLEIGSGCGAITGDLARRAGSVTCIELSKKRSTINATRHMDCDNLTIMVGNFETIEPNLTEKYDVITLIGVLEYSGAYLTSEHKHHSMLNRLKEHLAPGGRIVIAIENRLGLKYFAGCKEDHTGQYFGGIQGYAKEQGVRTFSKDQLELLIHECGLSTKFYYPYPDYKLPHTIYSDDKLPAKGELNTNLRNFDNDRMILFDEEKAFDALIEEGEFPTYSNSFIVVATATDSYDNWDNVPIYAKYSDERMESLRVATKIVKSYDGKRSVYKEAVSARANEHIRSVCDNYSALLKVYDSDKMKPNKCKLIAGVEPHPLVAGIPSKARDQVELEFLVGISMESYISSLERAGEYETIEKILEQYLDYISNPESSMEFESTFDFEKIFGRRTFKKSYKSAAVTNFDLIFSNIVLNKDEKENGIWNILDYEWLFNFPIPIPYIIYRALFYQFGRTEESPFAKYLLEKGTNVYSLCGIDSEECLLFEEMERSFQSYIIGGVASLEVMQVLMPTTTISLENVVTRGAYLRGLTTPKIYYSRGKTFSPDQRINLIAKVSNDKVSMRVPFDQYLTTLRIDPTEYPCIVYIESARLVMNDGQRQEVETLLVNGYPMTNRMILFSTDDSQIVVESIPQEAKALEVSYVVTMYGDVFYEETKRKCMEMEAQQKMEDARFKNKVLRKLHLKKRSDVPEGYYRIALQK